MNQGKKFSLNGEKYYVKQNINLFDVLTYFNYNNHLLVIEYNQIIWNKINWKNTLIQNDDRIEIVTIVGGG